MMPTLNHQIKNCMNVYVLTWQSPHLIIVVSVEQLNIGTFRGVYQKSNIPVPFHANFVTRALDTTQKGLHILNGYRHVAFTQDV